MGLELNYEMGFCLFRLKKLGSLCSDANFGQYTDETLLDIRV